MIKTLGLIKFNNSCPNFFNFPLISCPVASVLYRGGKEEGRRKKEEGRSFKKRKNFTYMAVNISPTFTRDYTNGHDIKRIDNIS
ncbi:hypothetical protein [Okeania sp. SIO1I7]|uniref:hypothetical protein n=1 Tax=Okeania sp. SIO1I7 TaxID=2607772 RepID=UPI0013FC562C|nr:hypothetical protein [Okeania sp. SIO1I7]NET27318.1 hypothetical protein [Okeania sp. SIO1I7]